LNALLNSRKILTPITRVILRVYDRDYFRDPGHKRYFQLPFWLLNT
jgi:hypothetical protein